MTKSELHKQLLVVLNDRNLTTENQAAAIEGLITQYMSSHDNNLLNSLSEVFDRSQRNL